MTREDKQCVISICRILADKMDDSGKVAVEQVISAVESIGEQEQTEIALKSVDEAIESLKEMIIWGDPYEVDADACEMAIEALKQGPKTGWVPVGERLPEESVHCLCCDKDGYMTIGWISEWSKGWFFDDDEVYIDVTAWMPLPEPYKAESEEDEQ